MKSDKIWGTTSEVFDQNNVEIHRIEIKKGGFCSKHYHEFKYNMFLVESGKLQVFTWKNNRIIDKTILNSKEQTIVDPKEVHKFLALEDTIAYEIYWVKLTKDDIIRYNIGGLK